ncbi:MAG: hypothetical protein OER77_09545 [Myxococcales bacterium]|nr:hypothetical protein [Myxococcales bacterium]
MRFLVVFIGCCWLSTACKPTSRETTASIKVVHKEPRCQKIGVVEGAGGNDRTARADAFEQAAERGATHIMLEPAQPDLEDGMTMIVTAKLYRCPPPDEVFPPVGYP